MSKRVIHTDKAPKALGPYSQAIETNGFIFASGQLGIDPATGDLQVGAEAQIKQALTNVASVLEEAGSSLENIVKTTIFFKDLANFQAVNEIYGSFFENAYPARSAFQVAKLPLDAEVEIEVVAVK
ncbi:RidA family protein [Listeria grayi]|uniref:Endoribonuclease L-PSP n=2 Tax=Listeria grayi TaxID=1641 RepID=D7V0L3_LISGR|nr:RidA family protein [Listeria grayi]EFI83095.1 putative endoribonuclease L-PSP [Listeria grayi DSM 20601]STY43893.1 RutC family protein HI_0719 [Listeria grayi]